MKVLTNQPYEIVYSLFEHEFLGYLFESYLIQLDDQNRFTFSHQNISSKNAREFSSKLDDTDFELISIIDEMQQDQIIKKFYRKKTKADEFFSKIYHSSKGDEIIQNEIERYLEIRRCKVLSKLAGKNVFEMGKDGEPAWKRLHVQKNRATILFHFRKNEDNTHYFPTIKHDGEKLEFQYKGAILICNNPAWMLLNEKIYRFEKELDGKKLQPFLKKKFILIPKKVEETYYKKFVAPLIASFDVYAKGFEINTERYKPRPKLEFSELISVGGSGGTPDLFDQNRQNEEAARRKILFELKFGYNGYSYPASSRAPINVELEKVDNEYVFHRINRKGQEELEINRWLVELGLPLKSGKTTLDQTVAFDWISSNHSLLNEKGITIEQTKSQEKKYFVGDSVINLEVNENIDWFDIKASVFFGEFEIPFEVIRQYILRKKHEFELPNGEIAVIPEAWFAQFSELMAFMDHEKDQDQLSIKKHHLALVQDLKSGKLAQITLGKKLQELQNFDRIEDHPLPERFKGELRPYQKAGYNWMQFLKKYNFGGCLADDMGLGKTVQTLAALQAEKESDSPGTSLLIMPTSLIYNWQMEAKKFTPNLKVLVYSGTQRIKETGYFKNYDLILTSYGIARLDIDVLETYYFSYIILDESQAIKNPDSNIAKAVRRLYSRHRLILTGTPIENSTLDLSQMSFVNPGLLGNQKFFKNEFVMPIEKKRDEAKTSKLNSIIKPFILRREKSQVATDLPEKIENIQYVSMSTMQEEVYEEVKSSFRNQILNSIELNGLNNSSMLLLKGLTQLRQIANHPKMVDPDYKGDSGKLDDAVHMLTSAIAKNHNVLIFSQFVKQLSIFEEVLKSKKIPYAYLDGSTRDRKGQVEKFQNNDGIKVFLISLKAGGLGLNLTKADYVFILDPWWNPAAEAQAVDRAHRIGQQNTVFTYKFITQGTVEEKILSLQRKKLQIASDLISTEGGFVKNLTKEDIQGLLS